MNKILKTLLITGGAVLVSKYLKDRIRVKKEIDLRNWKISIKILKKNVKNIFPNIQKMFKNHHQNPFVSK